MVQPKPLQTGQKGPSGDMAQGPPLNPQVHGDLEYLGRVAIQAINQELDEEGVGLNLDVLSAHAHLHRHAQTASHLVLGT